MKRRIGSIEREDGSVYRIYQLIGEVTENNPWGVSDIGFERIKPWSLEWIMFKIRKWRFL